MDWCRNPKTTNHLPFDIVLPNEKIIIEIDGRQHFEQVCNWDSCDYTRSKDVYKMLKATKNGYSIIRMLQEEIWDDVIDWRNELINVIYECSGCVKTTFIESGNYYDSHEEEYNNYNGMDNYDDLLCDVFEDEVE